MQWEEYSSHRSLGRSQDPHLPCSCFQSLTGCTLQRCGALLQLSSVIQAAAQEQSLAQQHSAYKLEYD